MLHIQFESKQNYILTEIYHQDYGEYFYIYRTDDGHKTGFVLKLTIKIIYFLVESSQVVQMSLMIATIARFNTESDIGRMISYS